MPSVRLVGRTAAGGGLGALRVLRADGVALLVFFGPALFGWGGVMVLLLLGVPGAVGGALLMALPAASFPLYVWGYRWADGRERRRRVRAFEEERLSVLAGRVVALYARRDTSGPGTAAEAEVFALFLRAQRAVEDGADLKGAGEAVEHGLTLADRLLGASRAAGPDGMGIAAPAEPSGAGLTVERVTGKEA